MIKKISSGSPWEDIVGYSRAIRVGDVVEVAGTTAMDGDRLIGAGDLYVQTQFIFIKIEKALHEAGATLQDVVRTRMYVTDIQNWQAAATAHGELFKDIKPVSTLVEVSKLIDPGMLIEIEATAIITHD